MSWCYDEDDDIEFLFREYSDYVLDFKEWKRYYNPRHYLFHYTSTRNAMSILEDMRINLTNARIPQFGTGVFLTKRPPQTNNEQLIYHIYRGNWRLEERLDCAFAIDTRNIDAIRIYDSQYPDRNVWKCDDEIDLFEHDFHLVIRN
jgi:hypothetical protein